MFMKKYFKGKSLFEQLHWGLAESVAETKLWKTLAPYFDEFQLRWPITQQSAFLFLSLLEQGKITLLQL